MNVINIDRDPGLTVNRADATIKILTSYYGNVIDMRQQAVVSQASRRTGKIERKGGVVHAVHRLIIREKLKRSANESYALCLRTFAKIVHSQPSEPSITGKRKNSAPVLLQSIFHLYTVLGDEKVVEEIDVAQASSIKTHHSKKVSDEMATIFI